MSISESLFREGDYPERAVPVVAPLQPDILERLQDALVGLFVVERVEVLDGKPLNGFVFHGKLTESSETVYPILSERLTAMRYTVMMEQRDGRDVVVALEGLITGRRINSPVWVHAALLGTTIITTMLSGSQVFGNFSVERMFEELFRRGNPDYMFDMLRVGAPFALVLLLILGIHEMGHYIAARRHGVDVTLPYFIPLPFVSLLGTLGAVIFIKSPLTNKKKLFDVGISGPLAGFVIALLAFIFAMTLPTPPRPNILFRMLGAEAVGVPPLLDVIGEVMRPGENIGRFISRQPIALAAWFGMLLTVLNLLPMGQLDGGHVMYALFGRRAWVIAAFAFGGLLILGLTVFPSFIFYAFLVLLTGLRHPPPADDITPLGMPRRLLGYATIVLFFLIATPTPFGFSF
jgi:Zn-dependent protease